MPTIALVDDDRNILTSVSIALEAEGYRIQTYTDGASALDGLKHAPPDLAIFDIKMPRMDGMEDRKSTRLNSSHANISYAVFCLKKKKVYMPTAGHAHSRAC